jgi:hypothetical protein
MEWENGELLRVEVFSRTGRDCNLYYKEYIRKFNWWSEALHGYANNDNVTVFPEPIGMAASFGGELVDSFELSLHHCSDQNHTIGPPASINGGICSL